MLLPLPKGIGACASEQPSAIQRSTQRHNACWSIHYIHALTVTEKYAPVALRSYQVVETGQVLPSAEALPFGPQLLFAAAQHVTTCWSDWG